MFTAMQSHDHVAGAHTLTSLKALLLPHLLFKSSTLQLSLPNRVELMCSLGYSRGTYHVTTLAPATRIIKSYVENGAPFLRICASAYYASTCVKWETGNKLEDLGDRPVGLLRWSVQARTAGALLTQALRMKVGVVPVLWRWKTLKRMKSSTTCTTTGAVSSLAWNSPRLPPSLPNMWDEGHGNIAATHCHVSKGSAILWGTHPEYPLTNEPLLSVLARRNLPFISQELRTNEERRWKFTRQTSSAMMLPTSLSCPRYPSS
ncbi:hypothetical protein K439DRAFT_746587 [Ramaria rubella]|nr:hypothetical protein K439DRAFT_746587 [Ramaria rubella]